MVIENLVSLSDYLFFTPNTLLGLAVTFSRSALQIIGASRSRCRVPPRRPLVLHHLILAPREPDFQSLFPRQTQFLIDVNDVDPGVDRPFQIFIRRAGTAM